MELVYCFTSIAILCAVIGIIFSIVGSFLNYRNKIDETEKVFDLAKIFIDCSFYCLVLGVIAIFFA